MENSKKKMLTCLFTIMLAWSSTAWAQDKNWKLFNSENSCLPSDTIYSVEIDGNNVKWIGSDLGLVEIGNCVCGNSPETGPVSSMVLDRYSNLWMLNKSGNAVIKKDTEGHFTRFDLDGISTGAICTDSLGNVWIGGWGDKLWKIRGEELVTYSSANNKFLKWMIDSGSIDSSATINCIEADCDTMLWIGVNWGSLSRVDPADFQNWKHIPLGKLTQLSAENQSLYSLAVNDSCNVWIGLKGKMLGYYDNLKDTLIGYSNGTVLQGIIKNIVIENEKQIWLGIQDPGEGNSLLLFHGEGGAMEALDGLSPVDFGRVFDINIDRHNNKWICTDRGLLVYNETAVVEDFVMKTKYRGLCYGPFRDGQNPNEGSFPSAQSIETDIKLMKNCLTDTIRTYGIGETFYVIPELCHKYGLFLYAGAWLDMTRAAVDQPELDNMAAVAQTVNKDIIRGFIVGNEILLNNFNNYNYLLDCVKYLRQKLNTLGVKIPVGVAETYNSILNNKASMKELLDSCDFIMVHIYPFWEGNNIEGAADILSAIFRTVRDAFPDKHIILGETGWPSEGSAVGSAVPGQENQNKFVSEFLSLSETEDIPYFLFEVFDEEWKTGEGDVGPHWGIFESEGKPKIDTCLIPSCARDTQHRLSFKELPENDADTYVIPMPFDRTARIYYYFKNPGDVILKVYDCMGRPILEINQDNPSDTENYFVVDGSKLAQGLYFYSIQNSNSVTYGKMILIK